jgi:hypothetical protein
MRAVFVALFVGLLAGGSAVWLFAVPPRDTLESTFVEPPAPAESTIEPPRVPAVVESPRASAASESERVPSPADESVLISDALRRYAQENIAKGWRAVRKDEIPAEDLAEGMKTYEQILLGSPGTIGRSLGERRTKAEEALEDARTGGVFALLEKLDGGGVGPLPALVRDPKQFDALFVRVVPETLRDGLANRQHVDAETEDGVTLTWPAGVFKVESLLRDKHPYPRDVTIAGAGMNTTMLVLGGTLYTTDSLRNFAIRDCTVHTNNNYLFDLRVKPAAIRFERVRFIGFDMGAGASCLLGTSSLALNARQCRFEGGYGRSPQHGQIFDVRTDALLARFESCTFSLVNLAIGYWSAGETVLFLGCAFDQIIDDPMRDAAGRPGVIFDGCSITRHEGGWQNVPKLDLNELFPNWKARME